jgi:hypothetical protein
VGPEKGTRPLSRKAEEVTDSGFISRAAVYVADALKYWEPRRVIYNAVLAAVVLGHVWAGWPQSKDMLSFDAFLGLFFLAVLANVCTARSTSSISSCSFRDCVRPGRRDGVRC